MNQPMLMDYRNQYPQTADLSPVRTGVLDRDYVDLREVRQREVRRIYLLGSW